MSISLTTAESVLNGVIHKGGRNGKRSASACKRCRLEQQGLESVPSVLAGMDNPFLGSRLMSLAGGSDAERPERSTKLIGAH